VTVEFDKRRATKETFNVKIWKSDEIVLIKLIDVEYRVANLLMWSCMSKRYERGSRASVP